MKKSGNYRRKLLVRRGAMLASGAVIVAVVAIVGYVILKNVLVPIPTTPESGSSQESSAAESSEPSQLEEPVSSEQVAASETPVSEAPASSEEPSSSLPVSSHAPVDPSDKYPALYVDKPAFVPHTSGEKVAYLTFDDGPHEGTTELLDILDKYKVKATFFVVGQSGSCGVDANPDMLREIVRRGHAVGIHSYTHNMNIYQSVDTFLQDFQRIRDSIVSITGVEPTIFRFPGGSVNGFNKSTCKAIIQEMTRRGYTYYDWNASTGDASGKKMSAEEIVNTSLSTIGGQEKAILLGHDTNTKATTTQAMPKVIEALLAKGYRFAVLDPTVEPINFKYQ